MRLNFAPEIAFGLALRPTAARLYAATASGLRRLLRALEPDRSDLHGLRHRADVLGRGAAATAQDARAEGRGFAGEEREIFGRRARIDDAVAHALGKSGVGHALTRRSPMLAEAPRIGSSDLWAQRAVRADDLNVFVRQLRGGFGRTQVAVGSCLLRKR